MKRFKRSLFLYIFIACTFLASTASNSIHAAQKPAGRIIGPTGFLGEYLPKWPKTASEIHVTSIEEGSPASRSTLKVGDVIVGVGDEKFDRHPLWPMADAVDQAEASDGSLTLLLKNGEKANLRLEPLGAYSPTAPYHCPKSEIIITQAADELVKSGAGRGVTHTGLLGLMATGEEKYIDVVRENIHNGGILDIDQGEVIAYLKGGPNKWGHNSWIWGYNTLALGEYYLLTRDEAVLPALRTYALTVAAGQDGLGLWGHKMAVGPKHRAPGYGVMNQPSLSNLMGLIIARKCGINHRGLDQAINKTYSWYAEIVGKGGYSYGNSGYYPEFFNNNGTSGSGAIIMSLMGNQKGAAFYSQSAATAYDSLTSGHADSFFNPFWTPLGASLSGPAVTSEFFKRSLWYFNAERHWQGGFPQQTRTGSVAGQALLMYCLPRKALLITGREADPSIYVRDPAVVQDIIMRSKIDYKAKSDEELVALLNHPFVQVRVKANEHLAGRSGNDQKAAVIVPLILEMLKNGDEQTKIHALAFFERCHKNVAEKHIELLANILRDERESLQVRIAAASALGAKSYAPASLDYYSDILRMAVVANKVDNSFRLMENTLAGALDSISKHANKKPLDEGVDVDKELLYQVANLFMDHPRQDVRQTGSAMIIGLPKEDFPIIAERLVYSLQNQDPDYHSYSQAVNTPAITLLADLNIKEGLDLLVDAIFHGGGKWAFKYRGLMDTLPKYGGNAEPYIETFEAHKDINKPGDRFTPRWQSVVKQIREDKNPPSLKSLEDVLREAKRK